MESEILVLFGSGGHAKAVLEAIFARKPNREIVIVDDAFDARRRQVLAIPITGGRELLSGQLKCAPVALAVGQNNSRAELIKWLASRGHELETVIHPAAVVGTTVDIGGGAFVAAGAILVADTRIGAGAIVNTGATVDHDCQIGESAHIGPGVNLCGNVRVGNRTLVGVGSSVRPGITIGDDVIIGAGSVVVSDLAGPATFAGNPARLLR